MLLEHARKSFGGTPVLKDISLSVKEGEIRGNFYKCADDSPTPHYGALFPVGSASLGFHNPEKFGTIKIIKR